MPCRNNGRKKLMDIRGTRSQACCTTLQPTMHLTPNWGSTATYFDRKLAEKRARGREGCAHPTPGATAKRNAKRILLKRSASQVGVLLAQSNGCCTDPPRNGQGIRTFGSLILFHGHCLQNCTCSCCAALGKQGRPRLTTRPSFSPLVTLQSAQGKNGRVYHYRYHSPGATLPGL